MGADSFPYRAGAERSVRPAADRPDAPAADPARPREALARFQADPQGRLLSVPLATPDPPDVTLCAASLPCLDPADGAAWEHLAAVVLADAERSTWRGLGTDRRRREWLLGRIAVKDALRLHLGGVSGRYVSPAGLVVAADAWGRPLARGPAVPGGATTPAISLAHTDGVALGAASGGAAGLGVDVERLDRRRGDFESAAFHEAERRLLDGAPESERRERALRLFCAKEAAAKAAGRGFMGSPLNLWVEDCDAGVTQVWLRPAGRLARALPGSCEPIRARVMALPDHGVIVALARGGVPPEAP
jgi:4'-phosphopantetheinyl transferase EntD